MTAKCFYCGAELPVHTDSEMRCPVCGEKPPARPEGDPAFGQTQTPEPPSPTAYSQQVPPPAPEQTSGQHAGNRAQPGPTEHTPAWELDGGFWLAKLWRTIWQVLLHPVHTFRAPGLLRQKYPLSFAIIISTAVSVSYLLLTVFKEPSVDIFSRILIPLFTAPFAAIAVLYLLAGCVHLFLLVVDADRGGFVGTLRVVGYAQATSFLILIPGMGNEAATTWMLVVHIGGLAAAHSVSRWRIVCALLVAIAFSFFILLIFIGCQALLPMLGAGDR